MGLLSCFILTKNRGIGYQHETNAVENESLIVGDFLGLNVSQLFNEVFPVALCGGAIDDDLAHFKYKTLQV